MVRAEKMRYTLTVLVGRLVTYVGSIEDDYGLSSSRGKCYVWLIPMYLVGT